MPLLFQVDRYAPATARQADAVNSLAADAFLKYREDGPLSKYGRAGSLWGHSRYQFVTVNVPLSVFPANDSDAEMLPFYRYVTRAINAATGARIGDVQTNLSTAVFPVPRPGRAVTYAWMVNTGKGATAARAWGKANNVDQLFFAVSAPSGTAAATKQGVHVDTKVKARSIRSARR